MTVQQGRDGELRVRFQDRAVAFDEIDRPQPKGRAEPKQRAVRRPRKPGGGSSLAAAAAVEKTEHGKFVGLWK